MTKTDGSTLVWNLDKGGLYDGQPVFLPDPHPNGAKNYTSYPLTITLPTAKATIPLCAKTHFSHGVYDPSFITLFAADPGAPSVPLTPEQKKKKRDYIIGASIGSILGLGVVLATVLVCWGQPTLSRLADPQRLPLPANVSKK